MKQAWIILLVWYAAFFSVGELGARAWVAHYGDAIDRTKRVLEMDAALGWKQRPNLHTTFLGKTLTTDGNGWRVQPAATSSIKTVVILGPSSSFGWGVDDADTYPAQLQSMLGSDYKVWNLGEIGYSTDQGRRLLESGAVAALHPDIIVFAYGVNDLDLHRFYFQSSAPDLIELSKKRNTLSIAVGNVLARSDLLNLASRRAARVLSFILQVRPQSQNLVRVPSDAFAKNYEAMILLAKQEGAFPVVLSTIVHEPQVHVSSGAGTLPEPLRVEKGVTEYDRILSFVAAKEKVPYLELANVVSSTDGNFVDPIHFSIEGNRIVATQLARIIRGL